MRIWAHFFLPTILLAAVFLLPLISSGEDGLTLRLERDVQALKGDYRVLSTGRIMASWASDRGHIRQHEIDREFQEYYRDDIKQVDPAPLSYRTKYYLPVFSDARS
jgi:hypothetical protein